MLCSHGSQQPSVPLPQGEVDDDYDDDDDDVDVDRDSGSDSDRGISAKHAQAAAAGAWRDTGHRGYNPLQSQDSDELPAGVTHWGLRKPDQPMSSAAAAAASRAGE